MAPTPFANINMSMCVCVCLAAGKKPIKSLNEINNDWERRNGTASSNQQQFVGVAKFCNNLFACQRADHVQQTSLIIRGVNVTNRGIYIVRDTDTTTSDLRLGNT